MVLRLKVKGVLLADITQGLVVLLAAGQQVRVGHIGQAQHGGTELGVQNLQLLGIIGNLSVQANGFSLVGLDLGVQGRGVLATLLHALLLSKQLAVFLGQLILLGGSGFGCGFQAANLHIQLQNPVNDGVAVHFLGLEAGFDRVGIFLDTFDIQHCLLPLLIIMKSS